MPWKKANPELIALLEAGIDFAEEFGPHAFIMRARTEGVRDFGSCMAPQTAYLHTLGLETLVLRINKSTENALEVAGFLSGRKEVLRVNYPSEDRLVKKLMPGGCGGLLTFELADRQACFKFMNQLKIIRRATNLNDNKTLVIHPSSTIYSEFSKDVREELGVPENLIRLSVGIEDVEDLTDDLTQALEEI